MLASQLPAEQEALMADDVGNMQQESPKWRWDKGLKNVQRAAWKTAKRFSPLVMLWTKINNDGTFNASATLAYTFLVSIFPIFLVILAIAGFVLGAIAPANFTTLENRLAGSLPGGSSGAGGQIVAGVLHQLNHSAGILLIVGILGALVAGSGLFLTLDSAFGVIFRLKTRDPIPQRIMAVSMVLLYVVLVPIMVFASILPSVILKALQIGTHNPAGALLIQILGLVVAFGSGCLFFAAIYFIVPNRTMLARDVCKGTLAAAVLLVMYELVFPLYESLFLHPNSYGSLVGFSIVILTFFYYLGFIVLLGAQINSMAMGFRPTTKPMSAILQELQERDLMIEPPDSPAAGTAATPPK
jgi:YihY family inner membrane protein